MLCLLTALQIFPASIDILRAFGQRTAFKDESYGGLYMQDNPSPSHKGTLSYLCIQIGTGTQSETDSKEYAYTIRYPEQHGRDEPLDPWSLRQMGVYHQCHTNGNNTFIVLQPSKPFLKRLKRVTSSKIAVTPQSIQMMALSAAMDNWRWYISDLEERYTKAVRQSIIDAKSRWRH